MTHAVDAVFLIWLCTVGAPGLYAAIVLGCYPRLWPICLLIMAMATLMVGLPVYAILFPFSNWWLHDVDLAFLFTVLLSPLHLGFGLMLVGSVYEELKHARSGNAPLAMKGPNHADALDHRSGLRLQRR